MRIKNNYTKLILNGLNLERYINTLRDKDIEIYNIHRDTYNKMTILVNDRDIVTIKDLLNPIGVDIEAQYGIKDTIKLLVNRIGISIGVVLSIIMVMILNMYTLHIKIIGISNIEEITIIEALNNYGIYKGRINNYNIDELNKYLVKTIDGVSLVSSEKRGTTLIINVKEKTSVIEDNIDNYYSPYNMIIEDYIVYSGISNIEKGQVVKKGDLIVYADTFIDTDGGVHKSLPKAKLNVTIFFVETMTVLKEEKYMIRTGESTTKIEYLLGKNMVFNNNLDHSYTYFETETTSQQINNYLLPITINKTIYYELEERTQINEIEKVREKYFPYLKELVYNKVEENQKVIDDTLDIIELSDRFILNYYVKCSMEINLGEINED